jgi:hypothetical protein
MIADDKTLERTSTLTPENRRVFRKKLRAYVSEALQALHAIGEWPRPFSAELNLDEIGLSLLHNLHKGPALAELRKFTYESGIGAFIDATGHGWYTRRTFNDVFLELYARRTYSRDVRLDGKTFDNVFRAAWAEIVSERVVLRRVVAFTGPPWPKRTQRLRPGLTIARYDINSSRVALSDMLLNDMQRHFFRLWPEGNGVLVSHEVSFPREPTHHAVFDAMKQLDESTLNIALAMRLATPRPVAVESVHTAQVSHFPLFPMWETSPTGNRVSFPMFPGGWTSQFQQRLVTLLHHVQKERGARSVASALATRYQASCSERGSQSVVDLVVCLEGLFQVKSEDLRGRLSLRVAALLGSDDDARMRIHREIRCAYDVRSSLVHGAREKHPEDEIRKSLRGAGFEVAGNDIDSDLAQLADQLRMHVRRSLLASISSPGAWPVGDDAWSQLMLSHDRLKSARVALGLNRREKLPSTSDYLAPIG